MNYTKVRIGGARSRIELEHVSEVPLCLFEAPIFQCFLPTAKNVSRIAGTLIRWVCRSLRQWVRDSSQARSHGGKEQQKKMNVMCDRDSCA